MTYSVEFVYQDRNYYGHRIDDAVSQVQALLIAADREEQHGRDPLEAERIVIRVMK